MSAINYGNLAGEFNDPNGTQNPVLYGVIIPVFVIMLPIFFARIYTRSLPTVRLWWDDLFLALAVLIEIAIFGISIRVAQLTGGRHIVFIPPHIIEWTLHSGFVVFIIAPIANAFIKISLSLMLLRIKRNSFKWRMFLWCVIAVLVVVIISATLTTVLSCIPVSAFWTLSQRLGNGGDCWPIKVTVDISYAFGAFFVFTDFVMAMLPIAFLRDIQLPLRDKIILFGLMASGLFAMGAGIAKIFLFRDVYTGEDYIYEMSLYGAALHLELLIGIIAACVPTLKAPFERVLKRFGWAHTVTESKRRNYYVGESQKRMNTLSNQGGRSVDATVSTSRSNTLVGRKDVIMVDASLSWESSSMEEPKYHPNFDV